MLTKKIIKKVKTETGASILFALLTLLVCAVIGSVVLTAGTAAAGRRAQTVKSDQLYYSANSAAALLREMMSGETVELIRSHTSEDVTAYALVKDEYGNSSRVGSASHYHVSDTYKTYLMGSEKDLSSDLSELGDRSGDLLVTAVSELIEDFDDADNKYGYDSSVQRYGSEGTHQFVLKHDDIPDDIANAALDVDVTMLLQENGDISFILSVKKNDMTYSIKENFVLSCRETYAVDSKDGTPTISGSDASGYSETYTTTTVESKVNIFNWKFTDVEVLGVN